MSRHHGMPAHLRPVLEHLADADVTLAVIENPGDHHPPTGDYAATYWTPLAGPSAMALARFVMAHDGEVWPADVVARCVGVRLAVMVATANRWAQFHLGGVDATRLWVFGTWPTLSPVRCAKLPAPLAWLHEYELHGVDR